MISNESLKFVIYLGVTARREATSAIREFKPAFPTSKKAHGNKPRPIFLKSPPPKKNTTTPKPYFCSS